MTLPFSKEAFFQVFARYNLTVFPIQIIFMILALVLTALIVKKHDWAQKIVPLSLAFFWGWMGIVYHILFFSAINPASRIFGIAFTIQGIFFIWSSWKDQWDYDTKSAVFTYIAYLLFAYAIIVYPILGVLSGHTYPNMPTFGLPCPTTIFTISVLILARNSINRLLWVIPILWSAVGTTAAFKLGVVEDSGLGAAGVLAAITAISSLAHRR